MLWFVLAAGLVRILTGFKLFGLQEGSWECLESAVAQNITRIDSPVTFIFTYSEKPRRDVGEYPIPPTEILDALSYYDISGLFYAASTF